MPGGEILLDLFHFIFVAYGQKKSSINDYCQNNAKSLLKEKEGDQNPSDTKLHGKYLA